jgi:Zn-dependent peptidase ImmA (M78 family)/transcriptional regulator with XRE-family HTH domain
MKNHDIGKRIREIREQRGLSQRELAELMGWKSHTSMVAIESGEQKIKMHELLKLATILNVSPDAFYSEIAPLLSQRPSILWRKKAIDSAIAIKEEHNLMRHYQDYCLVQRLVDIPSTPIKMLPLEICDISSATIEWANRLAEKIHRELRLGDYPAALLIQCLEEEYGVLLISRPLEDGSAACYREDQGYVVMVNEKEARWRQIFNVAHELFHLITWHSALILQIQSNEELFQKNEKLADAFAAALLMPQQMIDLDVRGNALTYSFIVALAGKYQVSKQAMLIRLRYLKFISSKSVDLALEDPEFLQLDHDTYKQAFAAFPSFGNRFIRLAYLAYEKGRLSKARLAQILSVKLRDLTQHLEEKGLCLTNDKEIEGLTC